MTGEAVPLEMRVAEFPSRAVAFLLDLLILVFVAFGLLSALGAAITVVDPALATALVITTLVAVFVGIPVVVETLTHGRSVGKIAVGLRVVRDDGGPVRFRHSLTRGLAGLFVDFYLTSGVGAVISSLLNGRGKRVGDLLAGTLVVRERAPATGAPLPPVPPQLEPWAARLELSRLPDDLALAARGYLARYPQLSPQVRESMGARLATEVAQTVSPGAPPGTPAWAYLTAVLTERRRREERRLADRMPPAQPPDPEGTQSHRPATPAQPPPPQDPGARRPESGGGFAPPV